MKEIQKVVQKLSRELESAAGGGAPPAAAYEPVQKHSHPQYTGVTKLDTFP